MTYHMGKKRPLSQEARPYSENCSVTLTYNKKLDKQSSIEAIGGIRDKKLDIMELLIAYKKKGILNDDIMKNIPAGIDETAAAKIFLYAE